MKQGVSTVAACGKHLGNEEHIHIQDKAFPVPLRCGSLGVDRTSGALKSSR